MSDASLNTLSEELGKLLPTSEEGALLAEALRTFAQASSELTESYRELQKRVETLDTEIARKNEQLARKAEEHERDRSFLRDILESLSVGVLVRDSSGRAVLMNRAMKELTGGAPDDQTSMQSTHTFSETAADPMAGHPLGAFMETAMGEGGFLEKPLKFRNSRVSGEHSVSGDLDAVATVQPVRNRVGDEIGHFMLVRDETEKARFEERRSRMERFIAMGEMAAELAHEIRNPLGSVELFASLLKRDLADDTDKRSLADHLLSGVRAINDIVANTLVFSRTPEVRWNPVNVHAVLEEAVTLTTRAITDKKVQVERLFSSRWSYVAGDHDLLRRALLNLLANSADAVSEGGIVTLATTDRDSEGGKKLLVTITDDGPGFPVEQLDQLLEPFFSTKERGLGLGLAVVNRVMDRLGGIVTLDNVAPQGARVRIELPVWDESIHASRN